MKSKVNGLHRQEKGIASLLFTLVMMFVISLVVIAFAQLARRGQRETLDSQLSTQAYYAAESGVNDVIDKLNNGAHLDVNDPKNCGQFITDNALNTTLDGTDKVSYTCALVNTGAGTGGQTSLVYSLDPNAASWITPINPDPSAGNPYQLNFKWTPNNTNDVSANCPASTNPSAWNCPYAIVRIDLVPAAPAGGLTRAGLDDQTMTAFIRPSTVPLGSAQSNLSANANNAAASNLKASCDGTNCQYSITNLTGDYYLRALAIYNSTVLTLTASNGSNPTIGLGGSQVIVDVTGKAQDVLRRIQVRLGTAGGSGQGPHPDYGLQTTDSICKRFAAASGNFTVDSNIDSSIKAGADGNPLCQ